MRRKFTAGMLLFIFLFVVACSQKEPSYEPNLNLSFNKPIGLHVSKPEGQSYTVYKKIEDNETVKTILDILLNVHWDNAKVSMLGLPDYKIVTVNLDPTVTNEPVNFAFWLSPNKDILEVIIEGKSKYGKISKDDTEKLLTILGAR